MFGTQEAEGALTDEHSKTRSHPDCEDEVGAQHVYMKSSSTSFANMSFFAFAFFECPLELAAKPCFRAF